MMFQKLAQWIREVLNKMLQPNQVKQALNINTLVNQYMTNAITLWSQIYLNRSPWLNNDIKSLNLGAAIASEVARAVTIEMQVEITGSPRADYLNEQMEEVVDELRRAVEYACAKGGLIMRPYISNGDIEVDFVPADYFYPVNFQHGEMTAVVLVDQRVINDQYYTRFEYHHMDYYNGQYGAFIENSAYKSSTYNLLGVPIALTEVDEWAELQPFGFIANAEHLLLAYFKMPMANNIDPLSPLGVSIYSRATDLIQQADRQWSDFLWEFESGKRALYTDVQAFKKNKTTGNPEIPDTRLYRLLDLQGKLDQPGFFEDWTPTIREANILNGLDAILRKIEFNCGLSYGILSNPEAVALTATEIKAAKQRFYSTVTDTQKALEDALEDLTYAMDIWATIGAMAPNGAYDAVYTFDDSIVADHDTQFNQDLQVVGSQIMSKIEFRMRNYGETEEIAREKLALVAEEQGASASNFFPTPEIQPNNSDGMTQDQMNQMMAQGNASKPNPNAMQQQMSNITSGA